jgi:Phospholipase_D-nuclease N-terminal
MALIMFLGFIALIALPSVLWLYALADAIINDFGSLFTKIVWLAALCFFPPLGTILYFLVGRSQRITNYPVGRVVILGLFILPAVLIAAYILYSLGHVSFIPQPPAGIRI